MIKTFTKSDVLKYIYKQLNNKEKIDFENELLINYELRCLYDDFVFVLKTLEKINLHPNKNLLDKIKSISKSYSVSL